MAEWTLVLPNNTTLGLTENNGLAVVGISGAGMPPIENIYTPYGLGDGALYQRASVQPRLVTVLIDAVGTSWVGLHNLRAKLIEAINPHGATPITLQYSAGGSKPTLYLDCYYDSGLEGGVTEGFMEKGLALRLLATDPYWYEDTPASDDLALQSVITEAHNVLMMDRATGEWSEMIGISGDPGYYFDGPVRALIATNTSGNTFIHAVGEFTETYGLWSTFLERWTVGTGGNDTVHAIARLPDSNVVILGGAFTMFASLPYARIVRKALVSTSGYGTGFDDTVYTVWSQDGSRVYAGGAFARAGGSPAAKIALWDGAAWYAIGAGCNGDVYAITGCDYGWGGIADIFVGGAFTTADGVTVNHVAELTLAGVSFTALGAGMNGDVNALCFDKDNRLLYAGGAFTTSDGVTTNRVAVWNGVQWAALEEGLNGEVNALWIDSDGTLYAGGAFTASTAGVSIVSGLARYVAGRWLDAGEGQLTVGAPTIYAIAGDDDYLFMGGDIDGEWTYPAVTSITNPGTARAYPVIEIEGPGKLHFLRNNTTGQELVFDLLLFEDETLTIDLSPGVKTITSDFRGNMLSSLVSGNLIDWYLDPGANSVTCWVADSTATATYSFLPRYWSADGAVPTP